MVRNSGLTRASPIWYQYPFLLLFPFLSGDPWSKALVLEEPLGFHCQFPISNSFFNQVIRGPKLWSYNSLSDLISISFFPYISFPFRWSMVQSSSLTIACRIWYQCPFLLLSPFLSGYPWHKAQVLRQFFGFDMNLLFSFSFLSFQVICGLKVWSYKRLSDFPANFQYQFLSLIRSPVVRSSGLTIASQIRY